MIPYRVIEAKRDGRRLAPEELTAFFRAYMEGHVHEYQMAAFLMAVYFRGLDPDELSGVTEIMIRSGERLDLAGLDGPRVDKHSTGGVGDKVSLALAPLVAELEVSVPMMAGRGLGHTGGTVDKLESIPGFRTDLSLERFEEVLRSVGCAVIGQTDRIAPLDRRLYDLRSVTATVPAIPLIATSIMSKKLAEDLTGLVLDVKAGEGAFIPQEEQALELARTMVGIGHASGVSTVALVTAMDRPLGLAVGNALEVREAVACLRGEGPSDLREVVLALATEMILLGGAGRTTGGRGAARTRAEAALDSGAALARFRRLVEAQGGDGAVLEDLERLPSAPVRRQLRATASGWVEGVTPTVVGYGVVELGGGRKRLGEAIDPSVGFLLHRKPGEEVSGGEVLAEVHAADDAGAERGVEILQEAYRIGGTEPTLRPLVSHRVTAEGVAPLPADQSTPSATR